MVDYFFNLRNIFFIIIFQHVMSHLRWLALIGMFYLAFCLTLPELQQKLDETKQSPFVTLMLVYDTANEQMKMVEPYIAQIIQKRDKYFKIFLVDCNVPDKRVPTAFPMCNQAARPHLPALIYFEPNMNPKDPETGNLKQAKTHQYTGALDEKSLYDFATPLMKAFSYNLKQPSDLIKLKQRYQNIPIVVYCSNKDKLSSYYKVLTTNLKGKIIFAHALPNADGVNTVCSTLKVQKLPALLLNGQTKIKATSDLEEQLKILDEYALQTAIQVTIDEMDAQSFSNKLVLQDLQAKIYNQAEHCLIHVTNQTGQMHPQWQTVQRKFRKMLSYYETQDARIFTQLGVKKVPSIVYFPKSIAKKKIQKTVFASFHTFDDIKRQISALVQDFTVPISSDLELQQLTTLSLQQGRLVAVLFHEEQISLSYRVLSNDETYKKGITFFRMKNPAPSILKKFQVVKSPGLIVMTVDDSTDPPNKQELKDMQKQGKKAMNLRIAQFSGKFNYDQLSAFLNNFVQKPVHTQVQKTQRTVYNVTSAKRFQKYCGIDSPCYLLLTNGAEANQEKNENNIKQLQKISNKIAMSEQLATIDAVCHSQILSSLDIMQDQLPTVVFLNPKFEKYTRLIGRVQQNSLITLINKVKSNRAIYKSYDKIILQKKDCIAVHKKIEEINQQSYKLSEQEALILDQIKRSEQQKKKQAQEEAVKNAQQKKRRKKRRPKKDWEAQEDL